MCLPKYYDISFFMTTLSYLYLKDISIGKYVYDTIIVHNIAEIFIVIIYLIYIYLIFFFPASILVIYLKFYYKIPFLLIKDFSWFWLLQNY